MPNLIINALKKLPQSQKMSAIVKHTATATMANIAQLTDSASSARISTQSATLKKATNAREKMMMMKKRIKLSLMTTRMKNTSIKKPKSKKAKTSTSN